MKRATHKRVKKTRAKKGERGFALLLVFLMASAVALMLYRQLPREAFESERDKEQMLIDRGEQYKRAIDVFYLSNNRTWPSKIEDLENTNNHRYLRHRYIDPYTGKDEWRLIHTNGAFLTDSLVTPPPAQASPTGSPGGSTTAGAGSATSTLTSSLTGPSTASSTSTDPNAPPEVNDQVQRRASDRSLVQNSSFQSLPSGPPAGTDPGYQPFNPAALPPISLYPNGYNAAPVNAPGQPGFNQLQPVGNQPGGVQNFGNQPQPGAPGVAGLPGFTIPGTNSPVTTPGINPSSINPTNNPTLFGNQQSGNPANPPVVGVYQPINLSPNQQAPNQQAPNQLFPNQQPLQQPFQSDPNQLASAASYNPGVPGVPGVPGSLPGTPGGPSAANAAIGIINGMLTTPRPAPTTLNQPAQAGGGLAGVASTHKGASIKSYGDRLKYQEWEFVFQLNPQGTLQAPQGAGPTGQGPNGGPGNSGGFGGMNGSNGSSGTSPGRATAPNTVPVTPPSGFGNN